MGGREDDLIMFKDSDRDSVNEYFEKIRKHSLVDTPTRIINESNEFLPR